MIFTSLARVLPVAALVAASLCGAQRQAAPAQSVAGAYDFSFVPNNKEPITGHVVISNKAGRFDGVVTSPKLSEPLQADSVHVDGTHVFTSILDGAYTLDFQVNDGTISNATFTKTMNGATEQGQLSIRKVKTWTQGAARSERPFHYSARRASTGDTADASASGSPVVTPRLRRNVRRA